MRQFRVGNLNRLFLGLNLSLSFRLFLLIDHEFLLTSQRVEYAVETGSAWHWRNDWLHSVLELLIVEPTRSKHLGMQKLLLLIHATKIEVVHLLLSHSELQELLLEESLLLSEFLSLMHESRIFLWIHACLIYLLFEL